MEGRMKKYRQGSPERAKVWIEKSPKYQQQQSSRKVAAVYYLSRNRQLEHPHFIEVSLTFPDGLYLRDVIDRLNVLRGRGMASMYSWSCKRSYKIGFVWHDLCKDDLILPARGNEYVLKGSELFDESNSGKIFVPRGAKSSRTFAILLKERKIGGVAHFYMDPEVQGVLTAAQKLWPHIHISDSLVMADMAVKMAKEGCQYITVLGIDFMSENMRAILDQAGFPEIQCCIAL